MNIAFVITDLEVGDVPLHLLRLATALTQCGDEIHVICLAAPGPVSVMLEERGIAVHHCSAKSATSLSAVWKLRQYLKRLRPSVVHSMLFHANLACRLVVPLAGISSQQLICEIQTVEIERSWHLAFDYWTQRLCRFQVGNSQSVVDHLAKAAKIAVHRLRCIEGGIDVERFEDRSAIPRSSLPVQANSVLCIWVGRMDPIKGLGDLISAMAMVDQQGVELLLVGDGSCKSELQRQVDQLGLVDSVHFCGIRSDVPELLLACDLFVFPSYTEGLPNALLEAMAAGLAAICTDVPGNRDLVLDNTTGVLVPAHDPTRLAAALSELTRDGPRRRAFGAAARERVEQQFTEQRMVQRYRQLYREVAGT